MDLLEQPDIKETYEKCKYIVKYWEYGFQKRHKRLPSKLDIKEADVRVRHAYKKYFHLKTAALEQSFRDVDGFDEEDTGKGHNYTSQEILNEIDQNKIEKPSPEKVISEETVVIPENVWGPHLNNKKEVKTDLAEKETSKPNLNLNITKKLFCGSKFTKRNPRKSLSFSHKTKSDISIDGQISASQPAFNSEHFKSEEIISASNEENMFSNDKFKIVTPATKSFSQPVNMIQSVVQGSYKPALKSVDSGWLKRVVENTGNTIDNPDLPLVQQETSLQNSHQKLTSEFNCFESTKLDYDSDDIIYDSDEENVTTTRSSACHIGKKRKIENITLSNPVPNTQCISVEEAVEKNDVSVMKDLNIVTKPENTTEVPVCDTSVEKKEKSEKLVKIDNKPTRKKTPRKRAVKIQKTKSENKKKPEKKTITKTEEELVSPRRSTRSTKVKASFEEVSSEIEDAFYSDTDDKDPEFTLESQKSKSKFATFDFHDDDVVKPKSKKSESLKIPKTTTKESKDAKVVEEEDGDDNKPYELEFSVKPRIAAPRYTNIKKVLLDNRITTKGDRATKDHKKNDELEEGIKNKREQAKDSLEKKIASGSLNDNFVRVNLKKKVFVRGKKGKNFSKYKKALWKSKKAKALAGPDMDMGGCDGGMLTCFNCGQIGHFARNCTATKGDGLLPLAQGEEEEECPFPTLEEASEMAKNSVLSVRVPKTSLTGEGNLDKGKVGQPDTENEEGAMEKDELDDDEEQIDDFDDGLSEQLLAETLRLEEHIMKLDVRTYMDSVKEVKPYYSLQEDGSMIDTPPEVYQTLQKFGHSSFRPGQQQAIMRILSGKSTLVTLSTGSGKSLCYQLPAYLYSQREPCISLIISPLVSLMDDQVVGIPKFMKAACLHSNQTKVQRQKILEAISMGELSVLLVSPEAVVAGERQAGFGSLLRKLPPIAFACIDEAHCVSQWSHNFRPSYLMICRVLRESLGVKTILGLTATATRATRDSIINHLQIPDGHEGVISDVPLPDNLVLSVSRDPIRDHALLGLLMSERFSDCKSIIVYCTRRDECERIASFLRTSLKNDQPLEETTKKRKRVNLQAEPYHAGLSASRRRAIQNRFMSGELRIVVATVAFGMGINKSDIRAVIHFNMPNSFESYVQEVGRAGRDGLRAQCHVFLDSQGRDENELRRHIHANSIDRHVIRKLLQKIFIPCSCAGQCPKHEVAFSIESTVRALDIPEENISTLLCYLELHENKYVEILSPAYTMCKVISYGGPLQIRKAAKECPPLAMALALHKSQAGEDPNVLEFPVVEVAAVMGWESGICKHKLKNLEWTTANNQPKRSAISVQFSNLGFHLLAPGNLSDDQLDEALDSLYNRVTDQEQKALMQLHAVHKTLVDVAQPSYRNCLSDSNDELIKGRVREYFNSPDPLKSVEDTEPKKFNEEQLVSDIRALVCMYKDNTFTGRAVARIFQGIQSPNYPAVIWGRCKFWRSHLDVDFHAIVKVATREILMMR